MCSGYFFIYILQNIIRPPKYKTFLLYFPLQTQRLLSLSYILSTSSTCFISDIMSCWFSSKLQKPSYSQLNIESKFKSNQSVFIKHLKNTVKYKERNNII